MSRSKKLTSKKIINKLHQAIGKEPILKNEYRRAKFTFWDAGKPYYISSKDKAGQKAAKGRFEEWFLFDYQLPDGRTPSIWYFEKHQQEIDPAYLDKLWIFLNSYFSVFGIEAASSNKSLKLRDLRNDKLVEISVKGSVRALKKNMCIVGRLFNWEDSIILSEFYDLLPGKDIFERNAQKKLFFKLLTPVKWEHYHKIQYRGKHPVQKTKSLKSLKSKMQPFLYALSNNQMTITHLLEIIRKESSFFDLFKNLQKVIQFRNEREEKNFLLYLKALWNHTPRKELGNKSILEFYEGEVAGPIEKKLLKEFFEYTYDKVHPENYANFKIAQKEMSKIQKQWMNNPRKDLEGLTPKQAILQERKRLGNPSKKIDSIFNLPSL